MTGAGRKPAKSEVQGGEDLLTFDEARALVVDAIAELALPDEPCGLDEGATIERPWGWVFFYNSQRYLDTQDEEHQLFGNAPYLVNRTTGEILETGTAEDIDFYIAEYEASLG